MMLRVLMILAGAALVMHDLLYHLGLLPGVSKPLKVAGVRIHHAYAGAILIIIGAMLL